MRRLIPPLMALAAHEDGLRGFGEEFYVSAGALIVTAVAIFVTMASVIYAG